MFIPRWQGLFADAHGTPALIRRLLFEQGIIHWHRYAFSLGLMAASAAARAVNV